MKYKTLILVLALLLTGCHPVTTLPDQSQGRPVVDSEVPEIEASEQTEPPQIPEDRSLPVPNSDSLFLYTKDNHGVVVRVDGTVVLQVDDGPLSRLTDSQTGELTGFVCQQQQGFALDQWDEPVPAHQWCQLYDLEGKPVLELPLVSVQAYGDFLYGTDDKTGFGKVYRRSTGQLLYDNVTMFSPVGDYYYLAQDVWGNPGVILTEDGRTVARTPDGCAVYSVLDYRYLVTTSNNLNGLLDETGQELFPCQYSYISSLGGYLQIQLNEGPYQVIDPATGQVVFTWDYQVTEAMPESLIVSADWDFFAFRLVDYDGNALLDQDFSWIDCAARDEDGTPTLLCGTNYADSGSDLTYFTPDGRIVVDTFHLDNGYNQPISDRVLLSTATHWDEETQSGWSTVRTLDFYTGQELFRMENVNGSAFPMYPHFTYGSDPEPGFFILDQTNEQNWYRYSILRADGTVVLSDLQDLDYQGEGVIQCTRGWTSGLMQLDGTWIYQESLFSDLED